MKARPFLIILLIFFIFPLPIHAQITTSPTLIFSLDQSFGNGIINQQDMVGLNRVISTLKMFQKYYPTYALLNPMNRDPKKLESVLNLLEQNAIPFVLDVYASDIMAIASGNTSVASPFDLPHGVSLSLDRLQNYKNRYSHFKGLRIFEISSMDYTLRTCRTTNPEWCEPRWFSQAANPFFDATIAKSLVQFANSNGLFVIWSDWHWNSFDSWDAPLNQQDQSLASIIQQYPNIVIPTYNNNQPNGQSRTHSGDWFKAVNKFSRNASFGLSDQAWLCDTDHMNCPINDLISWANSAIVQKVKIIQFEPVWYFFSFPEGIVWDPNNYTTDPKWINRGYATNKLTALAKGLNITDSLPTPSSAATQTPTPTPKGTFNSRDINQNGTIDIFDYNILFSDFGKSGKPGFVPSDINKDGKVNIFDYNIFIGNFGK